MKRRRWQAPAAFAALVVLSGCAQPSTPAEGVQVAAANSILAGSTPAAGATVAGPVDQLALRFSPPARLNEVVVSGPEGSMPMMITPVGEVSNYSLPMPGLSPGKYTVRWRATAAGKEYQGSFSFTVQ